MLPLAGKERLGRRTCCRCCLYLKSIDFKAMVYISSWRMSRRGQHVAIQIAYFIRKNEHYERIAVVID